MHGLALGTPATHSVLLKTDPPEAVVEKIFDYTITSLDEEGGAKVIAITGSRAMIGSHCGVTLVVETLDSTDSYTPTTSRIAALVVIDILSTAVALRRTDDFIGRFETMKRRLNGLRIDATES